MRTLALLALVLASSALTASAAASPNVSEAHVVADLPAALVDPYLQVQVSLAADRFEGVAAHGEAIRKAAAALGLDAAAMAAAAGKLAAAEEIAAARVAFGDLSTAIAEYAEKTKSGLGPDVRMAYCPMKKQSWLTRDKTIRNPYYGAAMLTCGSFK